MRRATLLAMALVWVVVVVAVSGVTWAVIQSAGEDVLSSGDPVTLPADGLTTDTASPSPKRGQTPRVEPSPSPSRSPGTQTPSSSPTPSQSPSTGASGSIQSQPQVRSWQGAAGTVTARCVGSQISLVSASPNNGWRIEVDHRGPQEVEVEFESGGHDERRTKVEARCSGGSPRFVAETDD